MTNSSAVIGIAEIALNVRDLVRMRQFYQDVLGFKLLSQACYESGPSADPEGEPTIAFLIIRQADTPLGTHAQSQLLALIDFQRHVFVKGRFDGHDHRRSTLNHLAFEISPESYETEKTRLEIHGISPRSVLFPEMGARSLFFADPEENVLELICHAPDLKRSNN
jgi:catechol 2,3-dioxygenase-like lactoylglutathione lyase family enzyme